MSQELKGKPPITPEDPVGTRRNTLLELLARDAATGVSDQELLDIVHERIPASPQERQAAIEMRTLRRN